MSPRKTLTRIAALGLATAAAAAPAAGAMPIDQSYPAYPTPGDLRGEAAAAGTTRIDQSYPAYPTPGDLRGEAAADGTRTPDAGRDLRGEAAADATRTAVRPLPGPPTWPEHPAPIAPRVAPAPVTGGTDDDAPVVLIALLGALALGGVAVFTVTRLRPPSQAAH
jgi:hypothetical protein